MKRLTNILFLLVPLWCLFSYAQTPFDSFAPEISRPMLDIDFIRARDAYHAQQAITTDTILYFVDITNGNIGYIDGLFSIPAEVTLYGPRGADNITTGMLGYTMTSDYSTFGAIEQGGYSVKYDEPGKEPPLPSHWLVVGRVPEMDGKPNNSPKAGVNKGFPYKTGIYVHSTNQSGYAGVTIWDPYTGRPQSGISVGCPLLSPKDYKTFENKMAGQKSFWLRITR